MRSIGNWSVWTENRMTARLGGLDVGCGSVRVRRLAHRIRFGFVGVYGACRDRPDEHLPFEHMLEILSLHRLKDL